MFVHRITRSGRGAAVLCALALCVGVVQADLPDVVFEITAEAGPLSVTVPILSEWFTYDQATQSWSWELPEAMDFVSGGTLLGTLNEFGATLMQDPSLNLNFAVQAGPNPITFSIASALLSFPTIPEELAEGQASAAFSLTDNNLDGATLTGLGPGGGAYLAQYNGYVPGGTTFAEGIFSMYAPFGTVTAEFNQPPSGYLPIGVDVSDMSALISFELTASDQASGTSTYTIIPEPGAIGLLVLGGLALLRRRS